MELSSDPVNEVRSRAVALLGLHSSARVRQALVKALGDADPFVTGKECQEPLTGKSAVPWGEGCPVTLPSSSNGSLKEDS